MRDASRIGLRLVASVAVLAIVLGAVLCIESLTTNPRPVNLSGTAVFPDHSAGNTPGMNRANEVAILLSFATTDPWLQGEQHDIVATIDVTPGSGVSSVELTTLILYLGRPGSPNPDLVNSDLVLLGAAGANRWISKDGPLRIWPNQDVAGTDFFLTFSLSLNVNYANGGSYGWGGWNPGVRIPSPNIVVSLAPIGVLLLAAGASGVVIVAWMPRSRRRRGTTPVEDRLQSDQPE